jgi:hypothetical protein
MVRLADSVSPARVEARGYLRMRVLLEIYMVPGVCIVSSLYYAHGVDKGGERPSGSPLDFCRRCQFLKGTSIFNLVSLLLYTP